MDSDFKNLLFDFGIIMDTLRTANDVGVRRALLADANKVLSAARERAR
jgi:hypothetical protein